MELTLESALSMQGLPGHAAYVVLIASMLMRTLLWLRILVIVSAIMGIGYASLILHDPVSTFWETLLVLVNVVQLLRTHWRSLRARFTATEAEFVALHLPGLTRGEARAILDAGAWVKFPEGHVLSSEGQPVGHLHYIAEGHADVEVAGERVSVCSRGNFVGEMTVVTGAPATATVSIGSATAVLWRIEADRLRRILSAQDRLSREVDAAFARNYRDKLARMNRRALMAYDPV